MIDAFGFHLGLDIDHELKLGELTEHQNNPSAGERLPTRINRKAGLDLKPRH